MTPRTLLPPRAALVAAALLAGSAAAWAQMATADRVQEPGFWPTQGTAARKDFLGPAACARCHGSHAESQAGTSMARTAMHARDAPTLRDNPSLRFQSDPYAYEVTTTGDRSRYTVTGPKGAASADLAWAFGAGKVGQSYLFQKDGVFQEARLSFFESLHGAGRTPARIDAAPRDLAEALARPVPDTEARRCFGCHTTASTASAAFDTQALIPGVTCEACHGPGRGHLEALEQKRLGPALDAILNPARLDPAASVDFCGACHSTFWDVKLAGEEGMAALRSQPNRLQSSKCWGEGDARLTCVACHDPHRPLVREAAAYDARCLDCHLRVGAAPAKDHPGRACPKGTQALRDVPHAEVRRAEHAPRVHGPPDPRGQGQALATRAPAQGGASARSGHGIRSSLPTVARPSSRRCASPASRRGSSRWMRRRSARDSMASNSSLALQSSSSRVTV